MAGNKEVSFLVTAQDKASAVLKQIETGVDKLKDSFGGLLKVIGVAATGTAFADLFKGAIESAGEAERTIARLALSVDNAGASFKKLRPDIEATIDQFARSTAFKKEDITAALQSLITVSGKAIPSIKELGLTLDLASARHIDLEAAAKLVGRVLDGNTTMLKKFGIIIKDGDDALKVMGERFHGFAERDANTFAGSVQKLRNEWSLFLIELGKAILGGGATGDGVKVLTQRLVELEAWVVKNEVAIGQFANTMITIAGVLGKTVYGAVSLFTLGLMTLDAAVTSLVGSVLTFGNVTRFTFGQLQVTLGEWGLSWINVFNLVGIHVDGLRTKLEALTRTGDANKLGALRSQSNVNDVTRGGWAGVAAFAENGVLGGTLPGGRGSAFGQGGISTPDSDLAAAKALRHAQQIEKLNAEFLKLNETTDKAKPKWQTFGEAVDKWGEAAKKAGVPDLDDKLTKLRATMDALKLAETTKAFEDLAKMVVEQLGTALEKVALQWQLVIKAAEKDRDLQTDPARRQAAQEYVDALNRGAVSAQEMGKQMQELQTRLTATKEGLDAHNLSARTLFETVRDLTGEERKLREQVDEVTNSNKTAGEKEKELAELKKKLAEVTALLNEAIKEHNRITGEAAIANNAWRENLVKSATEMATYARAAIGVAQAIGGIGPAAASALQNVVTLGESIAKIFAGAAGPGDWAAAIGSTASLLVSAFGGQPQAEVIAARKVMEANTAALQKLTDTLGLNALTGNEVTKATSQLAQLMAAFAQGRNIGVMTGLAFGDGSKTPSFGRGAYAGLDDTFLKDIAKKLGITIDDTVGSWRQLNEAFLRATLNLRDLGAAANQFFGIIGTQALQNLSGSTVGKSPILGSIFGGQGIADALGSGGGDPAKIQGAIDRLLDVFKKLQAGTLKPGDYGNLTPGQLLDELKRLYAELNKLLPPVATLSGALGALSTSFAIFGTSATGQLQETLNAMAKFSPAIGALGDGLDLASAGGIAKFQERIKTLFAQIEAGGPLIGLGALSMDELKKALLDLLNGAKNVAAGVSAAAKKLEEAAAFMESLAVRKLRAQGKTAEADDLAFSDAQKKEAKDVLEKYGEGAYQELLKIQAAERAARDAAKGGGALAGSIGRAVGATSVSSSSIQNTTIQQADLLVGIAQVSQGYLAQIADGIRQLVLRSGGGGLAGGGNGFSFGSRPGPPNANPNATLGQQTLDAKAGAGIVTR